MTPLPDLIRPPEPRAVEPKVRVVAPPSTWKCSGFPPAPTEPPAKPTLPTLAMTPPLVIVRVFRAPPSPYS